MSKISKSSLAEDLLQLVRASLWGTVPVLQHSLSDHDWEKLIQMSRNQTVCGLLYEGVRLLDKAQMPSKDLLLSLTIHTDAIEQHNHRVQKCQESLLETFCQKGWHPVVEKGLTLSEYYDQPLLRQNGDIDLYFPIEGEDGKARQFIKSRQKELEMLPDGSWLFLWNGIEVDVHPRPVDLLPESFPGLEFDMEQHRLSPESELLMLNLHILKHTISSGIGLRQFCDLARAYKSLEGKYDKTRLLAWIKDLNLEKWTRLLHSFLCQDLSLEEKYLPEENLVRVSTKRLKRIIVAGGNFGMHYDSWWNRDGRKYLVVRKANTALLLAKNMSFSIYYAPRYYARYIRTLIKGNKK